MSVLTSSGAIRNDQVSTERVLSTAVSLLRGSYYLELHKLKCTYSKGVLTVTGYVSTYYLWQVVQALLQSCAGSATIDNQVIVTHLPGGRNV
jgi:hypothetical protein